MLQKFVFPGPGQWLILPWDAHISHSGSDLCPVCSTSQSSSLLLAWGSSGGWPKFWGPCIHVRDAEDTPGSWIQIRSAQAVRTIWGLNQRMEDLSFCLSFSLCKMFLSNTKKWNLKIMSCVTPLHKLKVLQGIWHRGRIAMSWLRNSASWVLSSLLIQVLRGFLWLLPTVRKTPLEFWAAGFSLSQPSVVDIWGACQWREASSVSVSDFQIKWERKCCKHQDTYQPGLRNQFFVTIWQFLKYSSITII